MYDSTQFRRNRTIRIESTIIRRLIDRELNRRRLGILRSAFFAASSHIARLCAALEFILGKRHTIEQLRRKTRAIVIDFEVDRALRIRQFAHIRKAQRSLCRTHRAICRIDRHRPRIRHARRRSRRILATRFSARFSARRLRYFERTIDRCIIATSLDFPFAIDRHIAQNLRRPRNFALKSGLLAIRHGELRRQSIVEPGNFELCNVDFHIRRVIRTFRSHARHFNIDLRRLHQRRAELPFGSNLRHFLIMI